MAESLNCLYTKRMKTCTKCGETKPVSEYNLHHPRKQNGKLDPACKACKREASRKRYADNPELHCQRMKVVRDRSTKAARECVNTYLNEHPCVDCGESDLVVLEFDHVRGDKVSDIARMVSRGYRLWRIEAEIAKCEVRCANCHRRVTAKRRKNKRM